MPSQPHRGPNHPLPVAVVGCGRMGKFHARVYSQMPQVRLIGVYDLNPEKAADVAGEYATEPFANLDELADHVSAVTIAVPTQFHVSVAHPFIKRGIACLIEKPLAKNVDEARQIVSWAKEFNTIVQVGHIERFNPAIRAMSRLEIQPRFMEVTRISPLTFRSIDVGVVFDMMIHDIDILLRLANSPVAKVDATGVSVIGEVEDVCNARLTFANGCVANLTASRLAMKTERRMRVFSPDAYVSIDYQKKYGLVARRSGNLDAIRSVVTKIRSGEIQDISELNFKDLVHIEELQIDDVEPLRAELESFVSAAANHTTPQVTAEDGLAAVETASRIVQAIPHQPLI